MTTTSTRPQRGRWRFPFASGLVCLGIAAGQMMLGKGFGQLDLDLGLGWVVIGVMFLLMATVRRHRWVREQRERGDLPGHASVE